MFSSIGLRLATRLVTPAARPAFSRTLFVSHFQTRSFLTTPGLARAAGANPSKKPSAKAKSTTTKNNLAAKNRVTPQARGRPSKEEPGKPKKLIIPKTIAKPPKRPPTSYFLYFREYNESQPKISMMQDMAERTRECAASWRALTEDEREVYKQKYRTLHEKWRKDRLKWFKNTDPKIVRELSKRSVARGGKKLTKPKDPKDPNAPRGVGSSFFMFLEDFRKTDEANGLRPKDMALRGGEAWHDLSNDEKQVYKNKREAAIEAQAHKSG